MGFPARGLIKIYVNALQARSRFEEDVHPNNHTSVWGSWWRDGEWGYACCHQFVKNSYCTGLAGERAAEDSLAAQQRNLEAKAATALPSTDAATLQVNCGPSFGYNNLSLKALAMQPC